ncbi:alpha/beta hydrolase [Sphingobacterium sp. SRCM116780]|uniref:alpha/beta fold hydrolase n=1 Tax=Sphingobacterium sp. SRCM116780 TaxID=2907623 RepID=UPI001F1A749E|nr:alpha/beta hydrolase [Sphingobacterium sp. SRCM116780]UIR56921.1 alpha/beta hydrolase [Sphingobacterium sp. SRCM116780]
MKKLKQIITHLKSLTSVSEQEYIDLMWPYICYSPKMPLRHHQEQLLQFASKEWLVVQDEFFSKRTLSFPVYTWGTGEKLILLTHGWGSKAADFSMLIEKLILHPEFTIIAFDAPGNGEAEGDLSNLILYIEAVQAIIKKHGAPWVTVGHSLGAMANVAALANLKLTASLIISLTPLVKLKENFAASMDFVEVPPEIQQLYFQNFEERFNMKITYFDLNTLFQFKAIQQHLVIYDSEDKIAPYPYLQSFLSKFPETVSIDFKETGHERILKSTAVNDLLLDKIMHLL